MSTIVNDNKLNLILTTHGKNRIAQAIADRTIRIEITKIKIGDGLDHEYYTPSETQTTLMGDLGIEFPVIEKTLLEDGQTISFLSIISENNGGFDIREVGLYENYNGVDTLFAISTQQPFVKPSIDYNYLISVEYSMYLKASNISSVYDQIVLTADNVVVTQPDLEDMMNTVLFAHANLIDQIQKNSTIIGYNRPTQLYQLINENKTNFSYITTYKNYSTLTNFLNPENLIGYWVFDFSRHGIKTDEIPDISDNRTNITSSTTVATLGRSYSGFLSSIDFSSPNYFFLNTDIPFSLLNELQTADDPFTMIFALKPNNFNTKRTLLARCNAALEDSKVFEVSELPNGSVEVVLYSNSTNYITFTSAQNIIPTDGFHSLIITYDPTDLSMKCYIGGQEYLMSSSITNSYTHMNSKLSVIYCFSCTPTRFIYANGDNENAPTKLFNADGTSYVGADWTIETSETGTVVKYEDFNADYAENKDIDSPTFYAWSWTDPDTLAKFTAYTTTEILEETTPLYDVTRNEGEVVTILPMSPDAGFEIRATGADFIIQYNSHNTEADPSLNVPSQILYKWEYVAPTSYIYTNNSQYPTLLFNADGTSYTGTDWYVYDYKIFFNEDQATYSPQNNKSLSILEVGSYVTDSSGQKVNLINSKVGLVVVSKEILKPNQARTFSLLLESTLGKNPCISGGF